MKLEEKPISRDTVSPTGRLVTPPFMVAVILLAAAAVVAQIGARSLRLKLGKQPLPLRVPLARLEERAIAPYRVIRRHVLDPVIVETLGTDQYLNWQLEDTSVPANDPLRFASLFVTYDTGGHNLVPHTPDVCRLGGGYEPAQPHENIEIDVPSLSPHVAALPVRVCTFAKTALYDHSQETVVYTFHCNGRFVATRNDVRWRINALANTYAYFSKVEISFPKATRAQSIEGARKLYGYVLPILLRNHWPDFNAEEEAARQREKDDR